MLDDVSDVIKFVHIAPSPISRWKTEGNKTTYVQGGRDDPHAKLRITKENNSKIEYILDSKSELYYEISGDLVTVQGNVFDFHDPAIW